MSKMNTQPQEDWQDFGGNGATEYVQWSKAKEGDSYTGKYISTKVEGKYKKPVHRIQAADGTIYGLNSAGKLDKNLPMLVTGTEVRVTYLGKSIIEEGENKGEEANQFQIQTKGPAVLATAPSPTSSSDDDVAF